MRYVFLAYIFGALIIVSIFGFRGRTFTEPPVEIFNDMDRQARVNFQSKSDFFADGLGSREPVAGTVPVGFAIPDKTAAEGGGREDFGFSFPGDISYYNSGRIGDFWGDGMPDEVRNESGAIDESFIKRGQERYNISCAICHGKSGDGKGAIAYYGTGGIPTKTTNDQGEEVDVEFNYPVLANIANFYDAQFSDPANKMFRTDGDIFNTISNGKGQMGAYGSNITVRDRWAIVAYIRTLQTSAAAAATTE